MKFVVAERMQAVSESATLKMVAMAKEFAAKGVKVYDLTAGEPDFPVPDAAKKAAIEAITGNFSRYTPVPGMLDLRKALSKKFEKDNGLQYAPEQITVNVGAKQSIFNFLMVTVNQGDEVIVPAPYWVSYPEMVKIAGGTPVLLPTESKSEFKISPEQLRKAITPKTKALIMNSPSNPTGSVYTRAELQALAKVLEGTNVWVISDEIYEKLVYEGEFVSFAALSNDAFSRTVTVNGFSKSSSMTGWRVGYAAGPKEIISAMNVLQGQSTSNTNSVAQKAAMAALELPESVIVPMREAFRKRRDRMAEIFSRSERCSFVLPHGAFYFFLNIEPVCGKGYNIEGSSGQVLRGSEDFAFFLLNRYQVASVAGQGFGADHFLRLSFAAADSDVEQAAQRIVEALSSLK